MAQVLEVKQVVEKWWSHLQYERKCNSTNTVSKIVNNATEEVQEYVQNLIAEEIKNVIQKCYDSKDVNDIQRACNAINGCFDNFIHAVAAVRLSFAPLISFVNFSIAESQSALLLKSSTKNSRLIALELLHSLSRILILILKLRRTQNGSKMGNLQVTNLKPNETLYESDNLKKVLSSLTWKIGDLLRTDDILLDTKNNLAMSALLVREILISNEQKIIQFHKKLLKTVSSVAEKQNPKSCILQFLMCSAAINTWSANIIDENATYIYLKFLINLCENYSSETPVILNTSRTLLLLLKHDCFKAFVAKTNHEKVQKATVMLLSCTFMLLEHPVACVRHSAKDFLQILAVNESLQPAIIESVFKLPVDKRCYFISLAAIANEVGSRILIERNNKLPAQLFTALYDPTTVSHTCLALENMILKDSLVEEDFSAWCELWIVPLLISLMNVLTIVAADIEKLLEKVFKKYSNSVVYIIDKWTYPKSAEELRYVITTLKISHKQGFKLKRSSYMAANSNTENIEINQKANTLDSQLQLNGKWKNLINIQLLEHCLHQVDDDIRVSAFSLLVEGHKSTEPYTVTEFKLILYFLKYNLNNQQPATRQKILGLIRKMLARFAESKITFQRQPKNNSCHAEIIKNILNYNQFLDSLVSFCFDNIIVGCNFYRLNTVLNILLLCFENINEMAFNPDKTNFYWNKFLVALDSSYEENKDLAVILSKKLDFSLLDANQPAEARVLYEKAFSLCSHVEPPDVLTGAYLLQVLINLPCSKDVLQKYFIEVPISDDVCYCCVQILVQNLKEQVQLAKLDLMTAATCTPMYGTLFAIRLIFANVNFSGSYLGDKSLLANWRIILNELVEICIEMTHVVGAVANSSSPEGHLPMDFQADFENLLSLSKTEGTTPDLQGNSQTNFEEQDDKTVNVMHLICENFVRKLNKLEATILNGSCDLYETVRKLKYLLKKNNLLLYKIETLNKGKNQQLAERNNSSLMRYLKELGDAKVKLEELLKKLDEHNSVVDWPPNAQVLLLCAWRSIKEATLYLGDFISKLPIKTQIEFGLLTKETIVRIGEELKILLCEIKHRGAFEHAYIGFTLLVNSLWKCSDKNLNNLPSKWLKDVTDQLESPLEDQKISLCSTRRSAGLPFMVQGIICSEMVSVKSSTPSSLRGTIQFLLTITENGVVRNAESKIHALNILRALFKHAQLGEHVAPYVSRALMVAIRGSRAATWSERNSSNLLFSSLVIRIFGVARNRDEISKKNRMTSRTFFQRYSEQYDFLLSEMELVHSKENYVDGLYPKPSLYLVLLILGRLYPPPTEDSENFDLSEFLPYINTSRRNPIMKIRELGAKALVPLIPLDRLLDELDERFYILSSKNIVTQNERHGILAQIKALLDESSDVLRNLPEDVLTKKEVPWIECTKWMLEFNVQKTNDFSVTILTSYIKVLHILFKYQPCLRNKIAKVIMSVTVAEKLTKLPSSERRLIPGVSLFLKDFYHLLIDVLACKCLNEQHAEEPFFKLLLFMLRCPISEVQCVPLKFLRQAFQDSDDTWSPNHDFSDVGAKVKDLLTFDSKENIVKLRNKILLNTDIISFIVEQMNQPKNEYIKSKVVLRMWLDLISNFIIKGIISISHSETEKLNNVLKIDFAKLYLNSGDKELSTNALICYSVYLMEEIILKTEQEALPECRKILHDILNKFSSTDSDVRERMAVARIMSGCCHNLTDRKIFTDPVTMNIWMIPFKLLADEDPAVRVIAGDLVHRMRVHVAENVPLERHVVQISTLDWPHMPLVTLKAQEFLLDLYINILGRDNIVYLVVQMLVIALSAFCQPDPSQSYSKDEFGVFEKGNPNPYCEELALSNLMCDKLTDMRHIINLTAIISSSLDASSSKFIANSFQFPDVQPKTLKEAVEAVTALMVSEENKNLNMNKEFSVSKTQIKNLRKALGLDPVF